MGKQFIRASATKVGLNLYFTPEQAFQSGIPRGQRYGVELVEQEGVLPHIKLRPHLDGRRGVKLTKAPQGMLGGNVQHSMSLTEHRLVSLMNGKPKGSVELYGPVPEYVLGHQQDCFLVHFQASWFKDHVGKRLSTVVSEVGPKGQLALFVPGISGRIPQDANPEAARLALHTWRESSVEVARLFGLEALIEELQGPHVAGVLETGHRVPGRKPKFRYNKRG